MIEPSFFASACPRTPPRHILSWMASGALAAVVATSPNSASAQSEVRARGTAYVNLSLQFQSGDSFFAADGTSREGRNLEQTIVSAYGEVGLVDRWLMVTVSADLLRRNVLTEQGATTGLGDLRLGVWSELLRLGPAKLLSGVQIGLPTGDSAPEASDGNPVNELVARTLPTGDGEVDIEPSVVLSVKLSHPTYPLRHYVAAQGGYWLRTEGFSDAVSYRAELGTQIAHESWDWLWLIGRVRGVQAFEAAEPGSVGGGIGIGNGVSYATVGGEAQARLPFGVGLGLGADVPVAGRGVLDAAAFRTILSFEI